MCGEYLTRDMTTRLAVTDSTLQRERGLGQWIAVRRVPAMALRFERDSVRHGRDGESCQVRFQAMITQHTSISTSDLRSVSRGLYRNWDFHRGQVEMQGRVFDTIKEAHEPWRRISHPDPKPLR